MRRILAVGLVALIGLAGCGQAEDRAEVSVGASTTVAATTTTVADGVRVDTDPTTTTAEASPPDVPKRDDPKVRAKVRDELEDFGDEYSFLGDAVGEDMETVDESDIDDAINEACAPEVPDDQEMGMVALMFGQTLLDHGKDVAGFMADVRTFNETVVNIVDC